MAARDQSAFPTNRTLRLLGWVVAGSLALCGRLLGPSPSALLLQVVGATVFAIGTVRPSALRPIVTLVMFALRPIVRLVGWFAKANNNSGPPSPPSRRGQIANTGA
jgi:hypothetical protein